MTGRGPNDEERINAFHVRDLYLVKHYFDNESIFSKLKKYYNNNQYRFEIPVSDFAGIQSFLLDYGYALVDIDTLDPFIVVVKMYSSHPDNIFKESVLHTGADQHNFFLMKDQEAVEKAVDRGATVLENTDLTHPFN